MKEPKPFACPDPQLAATLARIEERTAENGRIASQGVQVTERLAEHVRQQNHRIEKIEFAMEHTRGQLEERERWEAKSATNLKWLFSVGMATAGIVSGIVFSILQALLR